MNKKCIRHPEISFYLAITIFLSVSRGSFAQGLPIVSPSDCQMNATQLALVDELIAQAIDDHKMPGCVLCIGRYGKIAWQKAYGNKRLEPTTEPMGVDTVFDMASITKPVATGTSVMSLIEKGRLSLSDKVAQYFPVFAAHEKESITVQDLLLHRSGLIPDNALSDYNDGPDAAWEKICDLKLVAPVGSAFKYSDVNFIVLGKIVEKISGMSLDAFSRKLIFEPLGMKSTGFLPSETIQNKAAPTEKRFGEWVQGTVHDPRALALGGVAGHAGLFSTVEDIAIYAQMMLGQGEYQNQKGETTRVLSSLTVSTMTRAYSVPGGIRGLGWDKRSSYSSNRGDLLSSSAFGHGGFTGTVLWIDPELDLFVIFLSNRVHPDGHGSVNSLAGKIMNVASSAIIDREQMKPPSSAIVLTGIDVLQRDGFRELEGQRVGLITNHTGRNQLGQSTVSLLSRAPNLKLKSLFSPEHGFEGNLDIKKVADGLDKDSGLKIHSLYGETRRPSAAMLEDIDTIVFDIQDVGTRFYTYISTMGEAMLAAAEHHRRFVILDRPNPIDGVDVSGPMLDPGSESFVGFHKLPVRHGMTIGELAKLFCDELSLELDLRVIECEGWTRSNYWETTGLTWINPSPNMRSVTQALLYPGIGLLEMTNLSVGRGTDTPFEVIGAPWVDGRLLATRLNELRLPGVAFIPIEFTPSSSKFAHELCRGVNIVITERKHFVPVRVGLAIAEMLHREYPIAWETKNLNRLLGSQATMKAILQGKSKLDIDTAIASGVNDFLRRREKVLLY